MLILVGVTVTVALNGGLFSSAQDATAQTETEKQKEQALANGRIKVGDTWYDSIEKYEQKIPSENQGEDEVVEGPVYKESIEGLATGVTVIAYEDLETETSAVIKAAVDAGKIQAVLQETQTVGEQTTTYTAVVPTGYTVSTVDGEDSITGGLVIYDGTSESSRNNEFVWIPVTGTLLGSYSYSLNYNEPKYLKSDSGTGAPYDSQTTLNHFYGNNYYTIDIENSADENGIPTNTTTSNGTTFDYGYHYNEMVTSVNNYDGFYIGRYETTIEGSYDSAVIGSKYNKTVLTAKTLLKPETETKPQSNENYYYRWWGLYAEQRNADVIGNGENVQTAMISGVLWDKTMDYIRTQKTAGKTLYDVDTKTDSWHGSSNGHTGVVNSAQANEGDVALNIWDLESNAIEWTQEAYCTYNRTVRGGYYSGGFSSSNRSGGGSPSLSSATYSSRLALYVK